MSYCHKNDTTVPQNDTFPYTFLFNKKTLSILIQQNKSFSVFERHSTMIHQNQTFPII